MLSDELMIPGWPSIMAGSRSDRKLVHPRRTCELRGPLAGGHMMFASCACGTQP